MWNYRGQVRPASAEEPGPGQESVWDYPRPPILRDDDRNVIVKIGDTIVAESSNCCRILETASPPTFYIPPDDVDIALMTKSPGTSACEWKGLANYWNVEGDGRSIDNAGWSYPRPLETFERIAGYFSFYPARLECFVGGERVRPQPGLFYGGWVTSEVLGPYKGERGTEHW